MPVLDITFTGSNAAFNYTDFSDIDIHIITRYDDVGATADNLFSTKKALWSNTHDIKIKGYAVELYVEDEKNPVTALGVWSLRRNKWVNMPSYRTPDVDDSVIRAKVEELEFEINDYLKSDDVDSGEITKLIDKLKTMRKAGLAKGSRLVCTRTTLSSHWRHCVKATTKRTPRVHILIGLCASPDTKS